MDFKRLSDIKNLKIGKLGEGFEFTGKKDKPAIMFVQGYTGIPCVNLYTASLLQLDYGYSVYLPRMPGHGTNVEHFKSVGFDEWVGATFEYYLNLKQRHETVHVAGLSMGAMISLIMPSFFPEIKKTINYAPMAFPMNLGYYLMPVLGLWDLNFKMKPGKINEGIEAFEQLDDHLDYMRDIFQLEREDSVECARVFNRMYGAYNFSMTLRELHKVTRLMKKHLKNIHADTLIITAKKDRTARIQTGPYIMKRIPAKNKKLIVLENSNHIVNLHVERKQVLKETVYWLEN